MTTPETAATTTAADETAEQPKYLRRIRSFVLREGRLTKGQQRSLDLFWPTMGLAHQPQPYDFTQVFGRNADLVLEIGFGMGKSLVAMAKAAPELDFIGIEVHKPGVGACLGEAETEGVKNLRLFEHDAVEILNDSIADNSLTTIQLFFPDPWHKTRHHKRRIVQPDFVQVLRRKLKIGGVFHMATDWENYAEHMLEVMTAAEGYQNLASDNLYVPRPDNRPLTKFENRGVKLGHGVWDLMFKKIN